MTCARRARHGSRGPAWDGPCTTASSPSPRRSHVSPDTARRGGFGVDPAALESRQLAPAARGRSAPRAARRVAQYDGRTLARRAGHRARVCPAARGGLALRHHRHRIRHHTARSRRQSPRSGLEAAAGRAGDVVVVTDGEVDDLAGIPADLLRRPRVIVQPRAPFVDAYVASVEGTRHVTRTDTIRLKVSYGVAGNRGSGLGARNASITVSVGERRLTSQRVTLPDSGTLSTDVTFPVSRIPNPGWAVLEVRLDGVGDAEPRDNARLFAIDVSLSPAAVIFASPPDWETRFLARTLSDVARVPVKVFVETEAG